MNQKEIAMNGAGVAELGFPMWPQFDPKTKQDIPPSRLPSPATSTGTRRLTA